MQLKDLENILVGNIRFRLVTKNFEGNFENIDEILPYEIQYLPANLRKENVLKIDVDKMEILLQGNETPENWIKSKIDESITLESLETDIKKSIDDNNLI